MPLSPFDPPTFGAPAAPTPFTPNNTGVSEAPPPARAVITALTGGGSQALDGQLAAYWKLGETVIILADGVAIWQLQAGAQATNTVTGFVRPADFDATLNARVFVRLVWQGKIDAEAAALAAQAYRDAAQTQANAAAASATQAALVVAAQFKGGAAGNAVPASLTNAGEWVVITADGTSHTIAWTRGDRAHWTGVAGSYVRVPGQLVDELRVIAGDATRALRDYVLCDGVTPNRCMWARPGTAGNPAGLPTTFLVRNLSVPAANPSAIIGIFDCTASLTDPTAARGLRCMIGTTGELLIRQYGATTGDYRQISHATFRPTYSGRTIGELLVVFPSGDSTTSPIIYADGSDISAGFGAPTIVGGGANWLPPALECTYFLVACAWPTGAPPMVDYGLGPWNAAEALASVQTGLAPAWWRASTGSSVRWPTGLFAQSSGRPLDVFAGPSSSGVATIAKTQTALDARLGTSSFGGRAFVAGRRYLIDFVLTRNSGNRPDLTRRDGPGTDTGNNVAVLAAAAMVDGYNAVVVTADGGMAADGNLSFEWGAAATFDGSISAFSVRDLGRAADWVVQPCQVCDDVGGNRMPLVLSAGMRPVTGKKTWRIPVTVDMTSTGNKQLLGAALFDAPLAHALETYVDVECAGAPTFSLGDGTTATRYTASTAYSAGRARTAVASPVPADSLKTGIYANVTTAHASSAAEKITLCGYRTD